GTKKHSRARKRAPDRIATRRPVLQFSTLAYSVQVTASPLVVSAPSVPAALALFPPKNNRFEASVCDLVTAHTPGFAKLRYGDTRSDPVTGKLLFRAPTVHPRIGIVTMFWFPPIPVNFIGANASALYRTPGNVLVVNPPPST